VEVQAGTEGPVTVSVQAVGSNGVSGEWTDMTRCDDSVCGALAPDGSVKRGHESCELCPGPVRACCGRGPHMTVLPSEGGAGEVRLLQEDGDSASTRSSIGLVGDLKPWALRLGDMRDHVMVQGLFAAGCAFRSFGRLDCVLQPDVGGSGEVLVSPVHPVANTSEGWVRAGNVTYHGPVVLSSLLQP